MLGKLIAHEQAVYFVRRASAGYLGADVRNPIAFHLDVTPIYQTSVAAGTAAEMALAPDAPCGGSNLAARVDTATLRVQHENGFVAVAEVFKAAYPTLPQWTADADQTPWRVSLATVDAAKACAPAIVGYQYTLRQDTRVVQTVYNPGFAPPPPRGCDQAMPTLALRVADQLGFLRGQQLHSAICTPWPGDASRTIVALVRAQPGSTDALGSFDLDVAIVKTDSARILQQTGQPGLITSDAMRFNGIALDTANYTLAPGMRALGLRTRHSHIGVTNASDETLRLYLPQGKRLKPILPELMTALAVHERGGGGDCTESNNMIRTIAPGKPGKQGYADLVVTEQSTRQEVKMRKKTCTQVTSKANRRFTLPFDGAQYVLPAELNQ